MSQGIWKAIHVVHKDGSHDQYDLTETGKHTKAMTRQKRRDLSQLDARCERSFSQGVPYGMQQGTYYPQMYLTYPYSGFPPGMVPGPPPPVSGPPIPVGIYPPFNNMPELVPRISAPEVVTVPPNTEPPKHARNDHVVENGLDKQQENQKSILPIEMLLNK